MATYIRRIDGYSVGNPAASKEDLEQIACEIETLLDEMEISVEDDGGDDAEFLVRLAGGRIAEGTYRRDDDGDEQILGYSIPVPDEIRHAFQDAWNAWGAQ